MINDTNQKQTGGDGSTNIQAQNVYYGVTPTEARQIAIDVYNANITTLSQEAARTALSRAEELTDNFLKKVVEQRPILLAKFNDPGIQMALLGAQREYARTGDKNLESLLVSLLFDRAAESSRNLKQISLEEAMIVLPKLTQKHIDILSLNLLITENWSRARSESALKHLLSMAVKFKATVEFQSPDIAHLIITGCVTNTTPSHHKSFTYNLTNYFSGMFAKGFTMDEFVATVGENHEYSKWLIPCPRSQGKFMMNATSLSELEGIGNYSQEERIKLNKAFKLNLMTGKEIQDYLIGLEPEIGFIFQDGSTLFSDLTLTPVGVAIACANVTKKTGQLISWPYSMRNISSVG